MILVQPTPPGIRESELMRALFLTPPFDLSWADPGGELAAAAVGYRTSWNSAPPRLSYATTPPQYWTKTPPRLGYGGVP